MAEVVFLGRSLSGFDNEAIEVSYSKGPVIPAREVQYRGLASTPPPAGATFFTSPIESGQVVGAVIDVVPTPPASVPDLATVRFGVDGPLPPLSTSPSVGVVTNPPSGNPGGVFRISPVLEVILG